MDLLPTMRSARGMARRGRVVPALVRRRLAVLRLAQPRSSPASTRTRPASSPTRQPARPGATRSAAARRSRTYGNRARTLRGRGSRRRATRPASSASTSTSTSTSPGGRLPPRRRPAGPTSTCVFGSAYDGWGFDEHARRGRAAARPCARPAPPAERAREAEKDRAYAGTRDRRRRRWTSSTRHRGDARAVLPRGGAVRAPQPGQPTRRTPGPALPAGVPRPARAGRRRRQLRPRAPAAT